jgi:hypothetical protein
MDLHEETKMPSYLRCELGYDMILIRYDTDMICDMICL